MKFKIIYQLPELYIEGEATTEEERKELIKGIIYTYKDLNDHHVICPNSPIFVPNSNFQPSDIQIYSENENVENGQKNGLKQEPEVEYVTEGQINYMKKLKIDIPENCTKIQAIDLINEYKVKHGWKK